MSLAHPLVADLYDLALDLTIGGCDGTTMAMVKRDLRRAAPSGLGLSVALVLPAGPVAEVFLPMLDEVVHPCEIKAWLHLDLHVLVPGLDGRATFYAADDDGLDTLAGELATSFGLAADELDRSALELDGPLVPGVVGLEDLTVVNRAVGVLLHRGLSLSAARAELRRRAESARTSVPEVARVLLSTAS